MSLINNESKKYIEDLIKKIYDNLFELQMIYFNCDYKFHKITNVLISFNSVVEVILNDV